MGGRVPIHLWQRVGTARRRRRGVLVPIFGWDWVTGNHDLSRRRLLFREDQMDLCTIALSASLVAYCPVASHALPFHGPTTQLVQYGSLACGIPPIPPVGCRVGACVCDQYGQNCQWTCICR